MGYPIDEEHHRWLDYEPPPLFSYGSNYKIFWDFLGKTGSGGQAINHARKPYRYYMTLPYKPKEKIWVKLLKLIILWPLTKHLYWKWIYSTL